MSRKRLIGLAFFVIAMVITGVGLVFFIRRSSVILADRLSISGISPLQAGDEWSLHIDGTPRATVNITLFNGLRRHDMTLILDDNGETTWDFEQESLIYAGESIVIARSGTTETRWSFEVRPDAIANIELFTTANIITAYGRGTNTVIGLLQDQWGNPPAEHSSVHFEARYPQGDVLSGDLPIRNEFFWKRFSSLGEPGRIRLSLSADGQTTLLEIQQIPDIPAQVVLTLSPTCTYNDGRDVVELSATVYDSHGYIVSDGTLVTFALDNGRGYGATSNGQAILRIPPPTQIGYYTYNASSANVASNEVVLQVTDNECFP